MSQLKENHLSELGIRQIAATCLLLPESPYIVANLADSATIPPELSLHERVFIPFQVDITGVCIGRKEFLGEFGGYICWYQPSYTTSNPRITMEDVALTHEDAQLYDFTDSIMRDNGQIQKQWCLPDKYFALLTAYQIDPLFRRMGIATLLFDQLHQLIRQECRIPIRTVFLPPPKADENLAEALMSLWRRLGYKEIGRTGRTHQIDGYFARCIGKEEAL